MRFPSVCYQLDTTVAAYLPDLRPAQRAGLALWVYGAVLAKSACQTAVLAALLPLGRSETIRQALREWLYDGADRACPCRTRLDVTLCFAPLLRWVLTWWQGPSLALALDATTHQDRVVAVVISVLYRGCAIPVAWHIQPATAKGGWMPAILRLLRQLRPVVPPTMTVIVVADRGLWSPHLWRALRAVGWHPLLRLAGNATAQPVGAQRLAARTLVPGPGHAWIGAAVLFRDRPRRRRGTLIVYWGPDEAEPWLLLTDLAPRRVGICWYGLRVWIELGFRALKGIGWQWQRSRRTDPDRVARHWLVLAVATLWVLASGTRAEDADAAGLLPTHLYQPPAPVPLARARRLSVFLRGLSWMLYQLIQRRLWRRLWLAPEPWPAPPPAVHLAYHDPG
jgi:hypothetical protein